MLKGLIQVGVEFPRSQILLDPALVLGLPGQSLDQVIDKMQGEILQGDVHFLVVTSSPSYLFAEKLSYFNKNVKYWVLLHEVLTAFLDPQIILLQCYQGIKILSQNHFYDVKTPTPILELIYLFEKNCKRKYTSVCTALAGSVIYLYVLNSTTDLKKVWSSWIWQDSKDLIKYGFWEIFY